jgi:hypothetical protein
VNDFKQGKNNMKSWKVNIFLFSREGSWIEGHD